MYILRRKVGEKIVIDDHVILTVLKRNGNNIDLKLDRPFYRLEEEFTLFPDTGISFKISDDKVTVTYLGHKKGSEHLGFDAPELIKITREEVYKLEGVKNE